MMPADASSRSRSRRAAAFRAAVALLCCLAAIGNVRGLAQEPPPGTNPPAPRAERLNEQPQGQEGRAMLARITIGFFGAAAGATALLVAAQYWGAAGLTTVSFGLFSLLYGIRILVS